MGLGAPEGADIFLKVGEFHTSLTIFRNRLSRLKAATFIKKPLTFNFYTENENKPYEW
jgi:hypothetical protein